jgi:hypothetical protein
MLSNPVYGTFSEGGQTQTAGTVINFMIQPWLGQDGSGYASGTIPSKGLTHVSKIFYNIGTTAHTLTFMRPLNYTTASSSAAGAQKVINIAADPGIYSTNYKYPIPSGGAVDTADRSAIAANDFIAYQLANGLFIFDKISSVSTLALTMTSNIPTNGGGIAKGGLIYLYGTITSVVPYTRQAHPVATLIAAASNTVLTELPLGASDCGLVTTMHPGDPMVIQSSNGTTAGIFSLVSGYYGEF